MRNRRFWNPLISLKTYPDADANTDNKLLFSNMIYEYDLFIYMI